MISNFNANSDSETLLLKSDLTGNKPLYVYISKNQKNLYWSNCLTELLDDPSVIKPLTVSSEAISYLLLNSVVPPPLSVFDNIFIISIGIEMSVSTTLLGNLKWTIEHKNHFSEAMRGNQKVDQEKVLNLLYESTYSQLDNNANESFIFHSAGKDSNPIAIAIAEAGKQEDFTLVTYKSTAGFDESEISKKIAKQLGFKHELLKENINFSSEYVDILKKYFVNAPFPCLDNVTLAYPGYALQLPELMGSNIIDGMGNDVYIGHIPAEDEFIRQKLSCLLSKGKFLDNYVGSENRLHSLTRMRAEWVGLSGFSLKDAKAIYKDTENTAGYWKTVSGISDYFDFRSFVRGRVIDTEVYMRKVRNFTDAFGGNVVFPWADDKLVRYILSLDPSELYSKKQFKNKIFIRDMMKQKINLNSDTLGKMGFSYSLHKLIKVNFEHVYQEIFSCPIWDKKEIKVLKAQVGSKLSVNEPSWDLLTVLFYRLFIISSWYNNCRWLKG